MSARFGIALIAAALLGGPAVAQEQSVVELAAKEKERRKNAPAAKTYTEEDLRRAGRRAGGQATTEPQDQAAGTPSQASAAETPEKTEDEIRAEEQAAWREKLQKANEEATALRERIGILQTSLNDLSQNLYTSSRLTMMRRLEETRQSLAEVEQTIRDLEEEGARKRFSS